MQEPVSYTHLSDTQGTGWFDIINNVDSIYPKIQRFPYPKAGTANSAVKVLSLIHIYKMVSLSADL